MKKALLLLLCLALLPALAGCGALRAGIVEVERLQLMQTMGLDPEGEALGLSLAGQGSILSGDGANITAASRALRAQASEKLLFTGHLRHILLGAETDAALLETALDYAARSPDLRLDLPVFLLREGRAEELLRELADAVPPVEQPHTQRLALVEPGDAVAGDQRVARRRDGAP